MGLRATPEFPYGVAFQVKERCFTRLLRQLRVVLGVRVRDHGRARTVGEPSVTPTGNGAVVTNQRFR